MEKFHCIFVFVENTEKPKVRAIFKAFCLISEFQRDISILTD